MPILPINAYVRCDKGVGMLIRISNFFIFEMVSFQTLILIPFDPDAVQTTLSPGRPSQLLDLSFALIYPRQGRAPERGGCTFAVWSQPIRFVE